MVWGKKKQPAPMPAISEEEFLSKDSQVQEKPRVYSQEEVDAIMNSRSEQPQLHAEITAIEILAEGEYAYKVITNYPLKFGACKLEQ
jgi:hypothetical protein